MSSETSWLQLTLDAVRHSPEKLEEALLQAGALAVTLQDAGEQPVLEPAPGETPLWPHTRVTGLFAAETDMDQINQLLQTLLGDSETTYAAELDMLAERDWTRAWLDDFRPLRFGNILWVCPHEQTPPDPSATIVYLDPGLAFGTGSHPTTALCLTWLDSIKLRGKTAIDYGCGSGILAIAAAKLGANQVWAVDIDPQALLACESNARANDVAALITASEPAQLPLQPCDVLLANILAGPLIELAPRFSDLVKPQGQLALAGLLCEQAAAVQAAFEPWFRFEPCQQQEDWVLLTGIRR
ncbi:MAG: 50S ribosomal protein L11 methyltransferase [Candidatus Competibacteraceae bacterium]|jgi:ribosomal protein L11 methyltransferase|nr:50S ribosomal protein L11 methyltransferase [Candidatus Competibacteraceae bacterium]